MNLSKTLTMVGASALLAVTLSGCYGLPSGQAGIMVAEEGQRTAEKISTDLFSNFDTGNGSVSPDDYEVASEATAETVAAFLTHYLKVSTAGSYDVLAEAEDLLGLLDSGSSSPEEIVKLDPLYNLYDYSGVPAEEQAVFALSSLMGVSMSNSFSQPGDSYTVDTSAVSMSEDDTGVIRATVDASYVLSSNSNTGMSLDITGSYYLVFTDGGWKIDVKTTMEQGF